MPEREKFRLNIVGADEDVPRMLLTYGKGCGGEVALILRPRDGEGVLVHQIKGKPARVWITDFNLLPEGVGPRGGGREASDAPTSPPWEVGAKEAVGLLKRMKAATPKPGPATLRGTWKGELRCNDNRPTLDLERKVASYGVLRVWSTAEGRWMARFERAEKWFSKAAQGVAGPFMAFAEAVTAGMGQAVGLVSEACSFRDTRRRNTVDPSYAEAHPYKAPAEKKDPTEKYNPRARYQAEEGAAGWNVKNDAGVVVASFGAREKGKAKEYASALNRGQTPAPPPPPAPPPEERKPRARAEKADRGEGNGKGSRSGKVSAADVPALKDVSAPESPSCPTSVAKIAAATEKEAAALEDLSGSLWGTTEGPELLRRAAKLIRHAESLVRSPLCKGAEQKAAWEDLKRAADAYNKARESLLTGKGKDVTTELRRIAERVSLAAAKAAKACSGAGGAGGTGGGGNARSRPQAEAPAPAEPPKRGRKPKAQAESPDATAEKDAILMGAFSNAIAAAMKQMQAGGGA